MLDRFTWFRQSAFRYDGDGFSVYIDPWGITDPRAADAIFITHAHSDHFSMEDIDKIRKGDTKVFAPRDVADELTGEVVAVQPGDTVQVGSITGQAVPAYNVVEERLDAHPKANKWVGYVLNLGGHAYYHAGDTDHAPELDEVKAEVAFLPIGGTYTMEVEDAAGLARSIQPDVAVPMHYGFVVGSPSDAERFAKECDPIRVEILTPTNSFELQ